MPTSTSTDQPTLLRLESLERSLQRVHRTNRFLATTLGLLVTGVGGVILGGAREPDPKAPAEIRARAFILEDEDHKVRGEFRAGSAAPALRLFDDKGAAMVTLSTACECGGAGLEIRDDTGASRIHLTMKSEGPFIGLFDGQAKLRASLLGLDSDDSAKLTLNASDGSPRMLFASQGPTSSLTMRDEDGRPRVAIDVREDDATLRLCDKESKLRAALGSGVWSPEDKVEHPDGTLVVYDADGKCIWQAK